MGAGCLTVYLNKAYKSTTHMALQGLAMVSERPSHLLPQIECSGLPRLSVKEDSPNYSVFAESGRLQ